MHTYIHPYTYIHLSIIVIVIIIIIIYSRQVSGLERQVSGRGLRGRPRRTFGCFIPGITIIIITAIITSTVDLHDLLDIIVTTMIVIIIWC